MEVDNMLKPNEAAKMLNVSVKTLQRWDREGILVAQRTPTDRRYYTKEQVEQFISKSKETQEKYKLLYVEHVYDEYERDDYDKVDKIIEENENKGLFYMSPEGYIIYKVENTKELASLFNINEDVVKNMSTPISRFIEYNDGGEHVDILGIQINIGECIDYLIENLNLYMDDINNAIENLPNDEESLSNEISKLIDNMLPIVAKKEIDRAIKQLKEMSKGNVIWE
jgi:DNA-binding transcriptional MerR regulator